VPLEWKPYSFPPLLIAMADMAHNLSGIADDDYLQFLKNAEKTADNIIEYIFVSSAAQNHLLLQTAVNILYHGLSDYSEVIKNNYDDTRFFAGWGLGEEKFDFLCGLQESYENIDKVCEIREQRILDFLHKQDKFCGIPPLRLKYSHKDRKYLRYAIHSPKWRDVPYIKLIAERGVLPI
jgi:hypothetical protein